VAGLVERQSSAGGPWREGNDMVGRRGQEHFARSWCGGSGAECLYQGVASKAGLLCVQAHGEVLPVALSGEKEVTTRAGSRPSRARSRPEGLGCGGCMDVCLELATTMASSPSSVWRCRGLQILVGLEVEDGPGPQPCRVSEATALRLSLRGAVVAAMRGYMDNVVPIDGGAEMRDDTDEKSCPAFCWVGGDGARGCRFPSWRRRRCVSVSTLLSLGIGSCLRAKA
jgi:hypothetical protein